MCSVIANLIPATEIVLTAIFLLQGSTPIDMAEPDMVKMLEELKKRQNNKPKINAVSMCKPFLVLVIAL